MRIALIGAGNLATHLGKALHKAGYEIVCVFSRTEESAKNLSSILKCRYTTDIKEVDKDADIYISAIKDSAFHEIAPELIKDRENSLFLHTAGSLPMDIWSGYAKRYGVIYPMQTFSKSKEVDFTVIPLFLEANSKDDLSLIRTIAEQLSDRVYDASSEQRRYLHIAAVFACNFSNHMYAICDELLQRNGIPFDVMLPLIDETAAKVHKLKPIDAQTGPAIRYDENVINGHLSMLENDKDIKDIYEAISKSINKFSRK